MMISWIQATLSWILLSLSFEAFCDDRKTYSAVIREFEIVGEAVGKLPESFRKTRPDKVEFGLSTALR